MGAQACANRTVSKNKAKRDIEIDIEEGEIEQLRKHVSNYIGKKPGADWELHINEKIATKNGV